jgi:5-dehydro-4-deoxyglucarate dehydratase
MNPQELKKIISSGLLSFPLTDFDADLKFAPKRYVARLEWLMPYGATALFAAGGTGAFFRLSQRNSVRSHDSFCANGLPFATSTCGLHA